MNDIEAELQLALNLVRSRFPGAVLYEVRCEERRGERSDLPDVTSLAREWRTTYWTVQVDNDRESANSVDGALAEMRVRRERKAKIPSLAERVAGVLRDIPDEGFERENVLMAAREILEKERGRR